MKWFAQAPSNIALIKYMGKDDADKNIPSNSSLSFTLNKLLSFVEIESNTGSTDNWEPLDMPGATGFTLTPAAQERFLQHLNFIKQQYGFTGPLTVRSCNNFPLSTGIASSASSFAALTLCAVRALNELCEHSIEDINEVANLSRVGSGSSCRSFYKPWCLWDKDGANGIELPYSDMSHNVFVVSHEIKSVHSTNAHARVKSSPHYEGRQERAEENLRLVKRYMRDDDWKNLREVVWREFTDMHSLFETAAEPFSYITNKTQEILNWLQDDWQKRGDGPLVTLDAGPNVHVLFRADQRELAAEIRQHFLGEFDVI